MEQIFQDIKTELEYARAKWGISFDSKNTLNDWAAYTNIYLSRATEMNADTSSKRKNLIKAAGLLISAIEYLDSGKMPPRHYDARLEHFQKVNGGTIG